MKLTKLFWVFVVGVVILASLLSCSLKPQYNYPVTTEFDALIETEIAQQDDETLIFVALSGGGTRAAAMSWKALETFKKIPYTYRDPSGKEVYSTLADEIDYISGISGGSFAAAAWVVYRDDMELFRKRFIERNIQGDLAKRIFWPPWNGFKLLSTRYDRINLAAELYDNEVFDNKTFGDLPSHPVLWVNATHLALGSRFTFSQDNFNFLQSDLSTYPVGYACAASSAFPILLSPITLLNYGEPMDLESDVHYQVAKLNSEKNIEQDLYRKKREFYNDKTNRYIHLADGGLVDNQGLQAIIDQFATNGIINKQLNDRDHPLRRLIIINVNAGVAPDDTSSKTANAPHVNSVIKYTMVSSMDILSAKRWMQIKDLSVDVYKAAIDSVGSTRSLSKLERPYTIEINFRNIKDKHVKNKVYNLPTSFYLDSKQLKLIDEVVPQLIEENSEMQRLKNSF